MIYQKKLHVKCIKQMFDYRIHSIYIKLLFAIIRIEFIHLNIISVDLIFNSFIYSFCIVS